MGEALKNAWILNGIYDKYDDETPPTGAGRPPKLVQLVNCFDEGKGMVSDKFHYLVAIFTGEHPMPLARMRGGLLRLEAFQFETVGDIVVLVIEKYSFVGAEGCPPHGDPRYIMTHGPLQSLITNSTTRSSSVKKSSIASWEATLQPEELCEMEEATQRLLNRSWDIDQYIEDDDWQIGTQIAHMAQSSPLKKPLGVTTPQNIIQLARLTLGTDYFARLDAVASNIIDYRNFHL